MAKAIFNVFFKLISTIVSIILSPINSLVSNLFPDFGQLVSTFNTVLNDVIGGGLSYFFSIFPPLTRGFIILYLSLLVIYYTTSATLHAILKVYTIIKNIKFW